MSITAGILYRTLELFFEKKPQNFLDLGIRRVRGTKTRFPFLGSGFEMLFISNYFSLAAFVPAMRPEV